MTVKESRLRAGSSLLGFDDVARLHLDGMLATYGFLLEFSKAERGSALRRYRNGHRYIVIEVLSPMDGSALGKVKLGTGKTDWPDCDWNHIPLSRMIHSKRIGVEDEDYQLDNLTLSIFVSQVSKDLQDYAMDFIAGELASFNRLRAEDARQRPPYVVHGSGPYSENTLKFMRVSKLLKDKYSSENAA